MKLICIPAITNRGIINLHHIACPRYIVLSIACGTDIGMPLSSRLMLDRMYSQPTWWISEQIEAYGDLEHAAILRPVHSYSLASRIFVDCTPVPPITDIGLAAVMSQKIDTPVTITYVTCCSYKYKSGVTVTEAERKYVVATAEDSIVVSDCCGAENVIQNKLSEFQDAIALMDNCLANGIIPKIDPASFCLRCPRRFQCKEIDDHREYDLAVWMQAWSSALPAGLPRK